MITMGGGILIALTAGRIVLIVDYLSELLTALDLDQGFELIGYSMGGAVAAGSPQTICRFVLLVPAGVQQAIAPERHYLSHVPLLGDWLFYAAFVRQHRLGTEAKRSLPNTVPDVLNLQQNKL